MPQTKSEKKKNAQRNIEIGKRIRARRLELEMTQRELGLRVRTSSGRPATESQISQWERGETGPEPRRYQALADALETTPGDLFGEPQDASILRRLERVEKELAVIRRLEGLEDIDTLLRHQRLRARRNGSQRSKEILKRIA